MIVSSYIDPAKNATGYPYIYTLFLRNIITGKECVYVGQSKLDYISHPGGWYNGYTRMKYHVRDNGSLVDCGSSYATKRLKQRGENPSNWICYAIDLYSVDTGVNTKQAEYDTYIYLVSLGLDVINAPTAPNPTYKSKAGKVVTIPGGCVVCGKTSCGCQKNRSLLSPGRYRCNSCYVRGLDR